MSHHRLRLTCVLPYPLGVVPSQRYRWEQWADGLELEGIAVRFVTFSTAALEDARFAGRRWEAVGHALTRVAPWLRELRAHSQADVVVVHRGAALVGSPFIELAALPRNSAFIYDFD